MKKKFTLSRLITLLISLLLLFICCKCVMVYDHRAVIVNNSNHSIGYIVPLGGKDGEWGCGYPDTLLPLNNQFLGYNTDSIYMPGFSHGFSSWEKYFAVLPQDTISVYIFHSDTLVKYPWETIREKYMILQRYDLSIEDLALLKYRIPYPPSEKMKYMKMFPTYRK